MIFHISGAFNLLWRERAALELVENSPVRLAHNLRQNIQAAAMGHAEHNVFDAKCTAALDDLLQRRNHRLTAIKTETLGAGGLDINEFLETFGFDQLGENGALALPREGDFLVFAFKARLQPALFGGVGDMHEFKADGAAIGAPQNAQHLPDGGELQPQNLVDENLAVIIRIGETVG